MSAFLAKLAMIGAAIGSGCFLRSSGLLTKQDAKVGPLLKNSKKNASERDVLECGVNVMGHLQAASRFVEYGTLPSLTLQTFLM